MRLLLLLTCLMCWLSAAAQLDSLFLEKYGMKKAVLGFSVGLEVGALQDTGQDLSSTPFESTEYGIGLGGTVGACGHFFLSEALALRAQAQVAVVPNRVRYFFPGGSSETYFLYPFVLDIPIHFMVRNPLYTKRLGFFAGPGFEMLLPVANTSRPNMTDYVFRGDAGISFPVDIGLGTYLLDLGYGLTFDNLIEGTSRYERGIDRLYRHRFFVRLNLY